MSHPIPDPPAAVSVTRLMHPETRAMLAAGFDRAGVLRPAPSLVARWVEGQWRGEEGVADLIARHVLDLEAEVAELRGLLAERAPAAGFPPDAAEEYAAQRAAGRDLVEPAARALIPGLRAL